MSDDPQGPGAKRPTKTARGIRIHPRLPDTVYPGSNPSVELPIASITLDLTIQQRGRVAAALVDDYSRTIGDWIDHAPVTVFSNDTGAWLADGFHRVEAARLAGLQDIPCTVLVGGHREALLFACGANATHGARRTTKDKRRAVETLLKDAEWFQWSDRRIAEQTGVDHKTVGTIRAKMGNFPSCASPATAADAPPLVCEVGNALDATPAQTAPADPVPLTLEPDQPSNGNPIGETPDRTPSADPAAAIVAPKRIGRDGKARAAPVPQETREIDYPKIHEETAAHLVKTAQSLAQMILSGGPLLPALDRLETLRVATERLLLGLLKIKGIEYHDGKGSGND